MSIQVWIPGESITSEVLLCRSKDADALRAEISKNAVAVSAYQVLPNGEPYIDLLRTYLALSKNLPIDGRAGYSFNSILISKSFERLATALTQWDDSGTAAALAELKQHDVSLHPQQSRFLSVCEVLMRKVLRRLLWGSPLHVSWPPAAASRLWWQQSADLAREITAVLEDMKNVFNGPIPPPLLGLMLWLGQVQKRFSATLFGGKRQTALVEGSAYCAAMSTVHFNGMRYSLAAVLCHRAADMLFTAACVAENLVDQTKAYGEGELNAPVRGDTGLSLLNCYDALVQATVIPRKSSDRQVLERLNQVRNRLLLTHSLGSCAPTSTGPELKAVVELLKAHGGPEWVSSYSFYLHGISLTAPQFYELSEGLMQTLVAL